MARSRARRGLSFSGPIIWMGFCVLVAAVVVQTTRSGIDILALVFAGFSLLLLERTVGDWVAESVGPAPTALIFAVVAGLGVAYITTDGGRGRAGRLFAAAETRGYRTAYFNVPRSGEASRAAPSSSVSNAIARVSRSAPIKSTPNAPTVSVIRVTPRGGQDAPVPGVGSAPAEGVRIARLSVSPDVSLTGQPIILRASLSFEQAGTLPRVEFTVDERVVARASPSATGVAEALWKTDIPGRYVVRVRLVGGPLGSSATSAAINVLPGHK